MARRDQWIDAARGTALAFVVLFHVNGLLLVEDFPVSESLLAVDAVLDGFRMPTLLMISGILAASIRTWSWADVMRRRVVPLLLLYVVWGTIILLAIAAMKGGIHASTAQGFWLMFARPYGAVWYLAALAAYIALARLLRHAPTLAVIAAAVVLNVWSYALWPQAGSPHDMHMWLYLSQHWVFFVCAERGARHYRAVAERTTPGRGLIALGAYGAAGAFAWNAGLLQGTGVDRSAMPALVLAAFGTLASLTLFPVIAHLRALSWAVAMGRRSLGVYVTHRVIAILLVGLLAPTLTHAHIRGFGTAVPLGLTVLTIVAAYGLVALITKFAPMPLLRPWWGTTARESQPVLARAE